MLGATEPQLISIAEQNGAVAKFPGRGGAVVGTCDLDKLSKVRRAYEREGFVFVEKEPHFIGRW